MLGKSFFLEGMLLNFVVLKNRKRDADDPLIYLVTSLREPARSVADRYGMRWKIEALRSAAAVQAYENKWFFLGGHKFGDGISVPIADGHCGVRVCAINQGRAENVQKGADKTIPGRVRGKGGVRIQARPEQLDAILCQPAHFLPASVQ